MLCLLYPSILHTSDICIAHRFLLRHAMLPLAKIDSAVI